MSEKVNKYQCFSVSVQEHIAHITLIRPEKRNSMIEPFWFELPAIIAQIEKAAVARVIIISSTGPHFSTGMDVSVFAGNDNQTDAVTGGRTDQVMPGLQFYETVNRLQCSFSALENARIPVLVAVQGGCIGAGLDLVCAADIRYATQDAFFTLFETNLAMTADVGTFPRICKLIPDGRVRELAYTGRQMPASEAQTCGLVNALFDNQEALLEGVYDVARQIASKAPVAVYGCKSMILHARDHSVADTLNHVALWNAGFFNRQELQEAMRANAEKRVGNFSALPSRVSALDADAGIDIP